MALGNSTALSRGQNGENVQTLQKDKEINNNRYNRTALIRPFLGYATHFSFPLYRIVEAFLQRI